MSNTLSVRKLLTIISEAKLLLRTEQPDVLHCNSSIAGIAGVVAGRKTHVKQILFTAHGWAFNEDRTYLQRVLFGLFHWLTVFLSHRTIAVSEETKRQLRGPFISKKWVVIHNGRPAIDFLSRDDAREELDLPTTGIVSGTIGELHSVKQHDILLRAVAALKRAGYELTHVIIGDGQEKGRLEALIDELGVTKNVLLVGSLHEAARYLKAFDIYVQPSRSEALGYTVIEAAQAALPIIASRVGGIPEIITHDKDGLLVPSGDVEAITASLMQLLEDEAMRNRLGTAARARSDAFQFADMLEKTIGCYDSTSTS